MAFIDDIASKLSGRNRAETNSVMTDATTRTYVGTATSASEDGSVYVALSQDVTLPDDDDGEHGLGVEMPTTVAVDEGDEVLVTVFGGGVMKAPVVTGNPGWGDNVQAQVDNAETLAQQAEAVATATGQHFWTGDDGVHVTEVTQEDWNDAESPDYHSGANVLLNALGQLFRDGVNNLLAVLTSGIAIYDGNGNAASNILAEFMADHVRVGGNVPVGSGGTDVAGAAVQFFDQTDTHGSGIEAAMSLDEASNYYDMRSNVGISSQLADAERATDTGSTGNASLSLEQWMGYGITGTGEQFTETHSALVADSTYDGDGQSPVTSHARVSATANTGSTYANGTSYVELIADALGVGENEGAIDYFTMDAVRSAFPVTLYDNASASASAAASLSETAANFSRLTILFRDGDGNHASADVWQPDGKRVALAITWISGASTQEMYQRVRWVTISGTSISTYKASGDAKYRTGQVKLGATASVTNADYISIVHVIGWR